MAISKRQRLADAALSRILGEAPALHDYAVTTVRTPMRDGVELLGDHFASETPAPGGTVLVRTPYGEGFRLDGRLLQDLREAVFGTGAFTLGDFLGWSDQVAHQEDGVGPRRLLSMATARRRVAPALTGRPVGRASAPAPRGRPPRGTVHLTGTRLPLPVMVEASTTP